MSTALKHSIIDHPEPAYRIAIQMGISEVRLSKIVNGLIEPKEEELQALMNILGKTKKQLFSRNK